MEDWAARVIGGAGVALSLAGLILTWYFWSRAGPQLRVTAFARLESGAIHIMVASTGRLPVTLRRLQIRDHFTVVLKSGASDRSVPTSRWVLEVDLGRLSTPPTQGHSVELSPSASAEVDVPVQEILTKAGSAPTVTVVVVAQRGDGKLVSSRPLQIR